MRPTRLGDMMSERISLEHFEALQESAVAAASYLDRCERRRPERQIDAACYQRCADLLSKIFSVLDPWQAFPVLMAESPAARETAEAILIARHLEVSRLFYYPELTVVINRMLCATSVGSERR